jgi:class 3 adenylate cyclase
VHLGLRVRSTVVDIPETRYARSGDLQIAYQVLGDGPLDVVFVPPTMSCIEVVWDIPGAAHMLRQIASFARLVIFDRRGSGVSDGAPGVASLEDQLDDVQALMDAVSSEQVVLVSLGEGCMLGALFGASHPASARALVMLTPFARVVSGPGYEWAPSRQERAEAVRAIIEHWGRASSENPVMGMSAIAEHQDMHRMARMQRLAASPAGAATMFDALGETDVRDVLPSIQCPTLVLRRRDDAAFDERHSRYVADHVPNARYVQLPGVGLPFMGDVDDAVDEIERFLTGTHRPRASDRVLATVLFTDIVGSTEQATRLGDAAWASLLERHDAAVRDEVERHRGRYVKSLGDGALATFDGPSRAISSALAIRDRLRELDLDIRAGLHAGECELLGDDVGGIAVHIGARISHLAEPGEVLVSSTLRDLTVGSGRTLTDRGEHDLKGVPGPWRLYAVTA